MAQFLLGIDAGGSAVKTALFELEGRERAAVSIGFRPSVPAPGQAERDPEALWQAVCRGIRALLAETGLQGADVAAVGPTGYGNGLYLVDAQGRALIPGILAPDLRAAEIVAEWRAGGLEQAQLQRTFQPLWPGKPLPLLAWLERHRPEALARAAALLSCKDYLRLRLTGQLGAELTDLSTAGLLPGAQRAFDPALFALLGLERWAGLVPPLLEPLALAGAVSREAAAATGLRAGTPVAAGCCDNLAVMYGTGALEADRVVVMSGTWGLHQSFLPAPVTDGSIAILAHGATAGEWLAIEGSPASAGTLDWFIEAFLAAIPEAERYALCNRLVAETADEDPAVYFLPYLGGAFDRPDARGGFLGFAGWHGLGQALRGLYEGVAFEHRRHLERLLAVRPEPARLRFAGGAARSAPWARIMAAALQRPLEVPEGTEFAARGVAALAAVAAGLQPDLGRATQDMVATARRFEPEPALAALLQRRFETWQRLASALGPHWPPRGG